MEETMYNVSQCTSRAALFTPRALGRRRFSVSVAAFPAEDEASVDDLLKQTWTIFGVSALFGFQHNDELLFKLYGKRLREEVAATLMQEDVEYTATFSVMESINPRPSSIDPPALKVEVLAKSTIREGSSEKSIYKGIFMSWKTTRPDANIGNCIRLPLLLCRGARKCMEAVHSIMGRMFDCMVMELPANDIDLMWLVPIVILPNSTYEEDTNDSEIKMEYTVPGLPSTETMTVKFRITDLAKMLEIVNNTQNDEVGGGTVLDIEDIQKFHEILHKQMLNIAGLKLGYCTLQKISLPAMTIMRSKMKVMNQETMNRVLLYLNDKALNTFHTLQFSV